jgi:signal transduction histidine kinase
VTNGANESVIASTLRALLEPRRAIPILLVSIPMVMLQTRMSRDPLAAPIGILMCVAFVFFAPMSWRALFPRGLERGAAPRLVVYALAGIGIVGATGKLVPRMLGMGTTLLTANSSLVVCATLFLVGGWGLGRDIELEERLSHERARAIVLEREAEHARLMALRSHLDPHFLFNTLNAIAEWCRADPEVAERAVLELANILRRVLEGVKAPEWSLATECELARQVFSMHQLRDPEAFTLRWDLPEPLPAVTLPSMLLLPIVENAVKHGPGAGHRGEIRFAVRQERGMLVVRVENPGPYRGPREGSDGLPTVERRLRQAFGDEGSFAITGSDGRTAAELVIPVLSGTRRAPSRAPLATGGTP